MFNLNVFGNWSVRLYGSCGTDWGRSIKWQQTTYIRLVWLTGLRAHQVANNCVYIITLLWYQEISRWSACCIHVKLIMYPIPFSYPFYSLFIYHLSLCWNLGRVKAQRLLVGILRDTESITYNNSTKLNWNLISATRKGKRYDSVPRQEPLYKKIIN